jgi:hypothetical protein
LQPPVETASLLLQAARASDGGFAAASAGGGNCTRYEIATWSDRSPVIPTTNPRRSTEMIWIVEVQAASPEDMLGKELIESHCKCLDLLRSNSASGTRNNDGWDISLLVESDNFQRACTIAINRLFEAVLASGLPPWPLISVHILDAEFAAAMALTLDSADRKN